MFLHNTELFLLDFKRKFSLIKIVILYVLISLEKNKKNIGSLWSKSS